MPWMLTAVRWTAQTSQPQTIYLWAAAFLKMTCRTMSAFPIQTVRVARWVLGCSTLWHSSYLFTLHLPLLSLKSSYHIHFAQQFCNTSEDRGPTFACNPETGIEISRAKVSPCSVGLSMQQCLPNPASTVLAPLLADILMQVY